MSDRPASPSPSAPSETARKWRCSFSFVAGRCDLPEGHPLPHEKNDRGTVIRWPAPTPSEAPEPITMRLSTEEAQRVTAVGEFAVFAQSFTPPASAPAGETTSGEAHAENCNATLFNGPMGDCDCRPAPPSSASSASDRGRGYVNLTPDPNKPEPSCEACGDKRWGKELDPTHGLIDAPCPLCGDAAPAPSEAPTKETRLLAACREFIDRQRITCAETVYQADRVAEHSLDFIHTVCEIAGYAKCDDDE